MCMSQIEWVTVRVLDFEFSDTIYEYGAANKV